MWDEYDTSSVDLSNIFTTEVYKFRQKIIIRLFVRVYRNFEERNFFIKDSMTILFVAKQRTKRDNYCRSATASCWERSDAWGRRTRRGDGGAYEVPVEQNSSVCQSELPMHVPESSRSAKNIGMGRHIDRSLRKSIINCENFCRSLN